MSARDPYGAVKVPTALTFREAIALRHWAKDKRVTEAGSLLGYSTIQLARSARHVVAIDRHTGYDAQPNDSLRAFRNNLELYGVAGRVSPVVGDYSLLRHHPADLVFIDLDGTFETTANAIAYARAPIIAVHDFGRSNCEGVAQAVSASGRHVAAQIDTLVILV